VAELTGVVRQGADLGAASLRELPVVIAVEGAHQRSAATD
jgi:hypothetical protein